MPNQPIDDAEEVQNPREHVDAYVGVPDQQRAMPDETNTPVPVAPDRTVDRSVGNGVSASFGQPSTSNHELPSSPQSSQETTHTLDEMFAQLHEARRQAISHHKDSSPGFGTAPLSDAQSPIVKDKNREGKTEPYSPTEWFDEKKPEIAKILPDLQLLKLVWFYKEESLRFVGQNAFELSMLAPDLGDLTNAIQAVGRFLCQTVSKHVSPVTNEILVSWLHEQNIPECDHAKISEVFQIIRNGVKTLPGSERKLVDQILAREGHTKVTTSSSNAVNAGAKQTAEAGPSPQNRLKAEYPQHFSKASTPGVNRYFSLPYLLDGSKESQTDLCVVHALLWGKLDFATVAKSKLYFTRKFNISNLAKSVHKSHETVKTSLRRLEDQYRVHIPIPPARGRNSTTIHIGVQRGILFAPVLTPQTLWNMSMKAYLDATQKGEQEKTAKEVQRLTRHHARLPDGDEKTRFGEILDELR